MSIRIIQGDVRDVLPTLPADYFDCIVTSPPYYGLRDYGCTGQIGLEPTLDVYLETMVAVCRELRRVLKPSGVFFLNIGDSYARDAAKGGSGPNGKHDFIPAYGNARHIVSETRGSSDGKVGRGDRAARRVGADYLKPKDLCLVPERLGILLQQDSWWVRSHIIWHKKNPMPESCTDRPTSAHETIWMLTKSERYYYDNVAVAEYTEQHENVHKMPSGDGGKPLSEREERQEWPIVSMPGMPLGESKGVAPHPRGDEVNAVVNGALQRHSKTESQERYPQQFGETQNDKRRLAENAGRDCFIEGLPEVGQAEGCGEEALRMREGEGFDRPISGYPERKSIIGEGRPQAPRLNENCQYTDGIRVGCDQRSRQEQMSLLQENNETPDNGSCDPDNQRRRARSGKHRSGMQKLQQPEGEQVSVPNLRNLRNVWHVASQPFKFVETVHQTRVAWDAPGDGKKRKASRDCPIHGGLRRQPSTGDCDERASEETIRIAGIDDCLEQAQLPGCVPIGQRHEPPTGQQSLGLIPPQCSPSAIGHNSGTRKKDRDPSTNLAYNASAGTQCRTDGISNQREHVGEHLSIHESNTGQGEFVCNATSQPASRNTDTLSKSASSSASAAPICTCEWYIETTEKATHFATMPPEIAERCIKAASAPGGHILDPFGGAGTTGLVADRLGRDCTMIDLNTKYMDMARNRIVDDAPLFVKIDA